MKGNFAGHALSNRYIVHQEILNTTTGFQLFGDYKSNIVLNESLKVS